MSGCAGSSRCWHDAVEGEWSQFLHGPPQPRPPLQHASYHLHHQCHPASRGVESEITFALQLRGNGRLAFPYPDTWKCSLVRGAFSWWLCRLRRVLQREWQLSHVCHMHVTCITCMSHVCHMFSPSNVRNVFQSYNVTMSHKLNRCA